MTETEITMALTVENGDVENAVNLLLDEDGQ